MSKRIKKDGKYFRIRRGKLVEIPERWVGRTYPYFWGNNPYPRASKRVRKIRMQEHREFGEGHPRHHCPRHAGMRRKEDIALKEFECGEW